MLLIIFLLAFHICFTWIFESKKMASLPSSHTVLGVKYSQAKCRLEAGWHSLGSSWPRALVQCTLRAAVHGSPVSLLWDLFYVLCYLWGGKQSNYLIKVTWGKNIYIFYLPQGLCMKYFWDGIKPFQFFSISICKTFQKQSDPIPKRSLSQCSFVWRLQLWMPPLSQHTT